MAPRWTVDVIVIGSGPAGATAARELASLGHRVVLLTRPAPKPALAETIPPSTNKLLQKLGWLRDMEAAGFVRTTGNTVYWSGAAAPHDARYAEGLLGFQVDRARFNELLIDALRRSGCDLIADATVIATQHNVVRFVRDDHEQEISAPWILDCSGRTGVMARQGWRRSAPGLRTLAIVGLWECSDGWALGDYTHTLVESHPEGWAWSVPISRTQRHVTVMVDPRLTDVRAQGALIESYHAALGRVPALGRLTQGARLVDAPFARDASPYSAHRYATHGALLVGDAASFVDPLSSFGIKKALASAWLASVVVNTCLTDSSVVAPALEFYEKRERAMHEVLERQRAELARTALGVETSEFWSSRAGREIEAEDPNEELNVELLRGDARVREAFADLKRRESITLVPGRTLRYVERP
ncbi:MAG: NAD(P)/FAD-dependent oxidoreductase, partial [Gemmatimonadota bacterium]